MTVNGLKAESCHFPFAAWHPKGAGGFWIVAVVAAAEKTGLAEARLVKPSQVSQSREGLTNGFGYLRDEPWVRQSTHNWLWIWIYPVCDWTL